MKKIILKLSFQLALIIVASSMMAQEKTVFFDEHFPSENYAVKEIVDLGESINIIIAEQGHCSSWNKKKLGRINILAGTKTQSFDRLSLYTLDPKGDLLKNSHILYTPNGDTLIFGNPPDNKHQSKSLSEMTNMLPKVFSPADKVKYSYKIEELGVRRYIYKFDPYNIFYFPAGDEYFSMAHPEKEGRYSRAGKFLIDSVLNTVTVIYGRKDKNVKFNEYKDFDFITYNGPTNIGARFNIKFQYPRSLDASKIVYSIEDGAPLGKLFIFSRKGGIGKKYNDPDKNNFEIIFCSNEGELIFHKTSKLSTDKKGLIDIHGAAGDKEHFFVPFNSYDDDGQFFGLVQFDYKGNEQYFKNPKSLLENKLITIKGKTSGELNQPRTQLANATQTPGFNWGYSSYYKLLGAKKTQSSIYFWGQMVFNIDDPNYKAPTNPDGTPIAGGIKPRISLYGEIIIFSYNAKDMSFERAYMQNMPLGKEPAMIELIDALNDQAVFHIPVKAIKVPDNYDMTRCVYDRENLKHKDYLPENFYTSLFINIKPNEAKNYLYKDIFLLDLKKSIITRQDLVEPYIIGFGINPDNSQYFKIQKVDFSD